MEFLMPGTRSGLFNKQTGQQADNCAREEDREGLLIAGQGKAFVTLTGRFQDQTEQRLKDCSSGKRKQVNQADGGAGDVGWKELFSC